MYYRNFIVKYYAKQFEIEKNSELNPLCAIPEVLKKWLYSALKVEDIDFENGLIYVEKQFTRGEEKDRTKTLESTRIVHASKQVLSIVKWHMEKYGITTGLLFKDSTGQKPISAKWVSRKFKKLLCKNDYSDDFCRVHDLRGQFVDIMHYLGVTTEYIAREVGHSNTTTTSKVYTQILGEVHREANNKMDETLFNNTLDDTSK